MSDEDYKVGYGKPPRHTQFQPGESGNKNRKKKRETQAEIVARVRDEVVEVGGRAMTKFELALQATVNNTIKRGSARELKGLFELLDKYGAMPRAERDQATRAGADAVMEKIAMIVERTLDMDPRYREQIDVYDKEEVRTVLSCPHCSPKLRRQWHEPERKALAADGLKTHLQSGADELKKRG